MVRTARGDCSSKNGSVEKISDNPEDERINWFARWFKETPTIEDSIQHVLTWRMVGGETCFLGDANTLLIHPDFFTQVAGYIKERFQTIKRFTIYGRTSSAAKMPLEDLKMFGGAGLNRIHYGIESGNNKVLAFMKKGVAASEHIEGCIKTGEAGISCSVYIMPGLGGADWSEEHAADTADVLTRSKPDFVRIRTLEVFPGTGLYNRLRSGEFSEATEEQVVKEIRIIVENIKAETMIVSDSASNLLDIHGRLPNDRQNMLATIDSYLDLTMREKLVFSLSSRIRSFIGQYGGITQDIYSALSPYLKDRTVAMHNMPDEALKSTIALIRSKLMP